MRDEKIDAIARHVGYKSPKNLYRALKRLTGLTPTAFRRLSAERASEIIEQARATLHRIA